jgi:transposase
MMDKVISSDLRESVVALVDEEHSCRAAAKHFRVSNSFCDQAAATAQTHGPVEP